MSCRLRAIPHDRFPVGEKVVAIDFGSSLPEGIRPKNTYAMRVLTMESGRKFVFLPECGEITLCELIQ